MAAPQGTSQVFMRRRRRLVPAPMSPRTGPAPPSRLSAPRALARSHPICSRLRMPRHPHARASAVPDTRGACFRVRTRVLAHFVHGHAASLATECAPFGRVSRRHCGASESRIERDPPRDPVGSGRARGWQVSLRDVFPCANGFLRTVGLRASAAHLRTHSPVCSSPRDEERRLRRGKLRATPVFCVQWPRHARILHGNSAVDVPETPCFVRGHPRRPHAPGRREIPPPGRANQGDVRDTPNQKPMICFSRAYVRARRQPVGVWSRRQDIEGAICTLSQCPCRCRHTYAQQIDFAHSRPDSYRIPSSVESGGAVNKCTDSDANLPSSDREDTAIYRPGETIYSNECVAAVYLAC